VGLRFFQLARTFAGIQVRAQSIESKPQTGSQRRCATRLFDGEAQKREQNEG
jgi:hypothetical protein